MMAQIASGLNCAARNAFVHRIAFRLNDEEHTEALRALHQIGEDRPNSRIIRKWLICGRLHKNSAAAQRLHCSL
jgi:hypothetical protein